MKPSLVLVIHGAQAWLCRGGWSRPVDRDEFFAWAHYSGVRLQPIDGGPSLLVTLATNHQERLFDLMWVAPED